MLSRLKVEHYKSLFDVEVKLEPLTVFIGPNGSGKSNICEALAIVSSTMNNLFMLQSVGANTVISYALQSLGKNNLSDQCKSLFWHGYLDYLQFEIENDSRTNSEENLLSTGNPVSNLAIRYDNNSKSLIFSNLTTQNYNSSDYSETSKAFLISQKYINSDLDSDLNCVKIYDFSPNSLNSSTTAPIAMSRTGDGLSNLLAGILLSNREQFDELEKRLIQLVPNIKRISLRNEQNQFSLELVDRYSDHRIPASEISDGTLRILAFLASLYQIETPSIICFEEIENGVHPWLLHKMIELLKLVSTEGINGKPVQVLITTHSPVLLDYVEPKQVRAVELDNEGKTQVHELPIESKAFQKALDAYDGALGELWFTNVFGGNPV